MQLQDLLAQMGGVPQMARELGIDESQAASGAAALLPAILGGFKKQATAQPTGLAGLTGMLGKLGGSGLLDNVLSPKATDVGRGNDVLGQIFGSKDVSRAVATKAAAESGLSADVLKKMLPMLAMAVTGYLSKQSAAPTSGGGLGGLVGGLLGGGKGAAASGGGLASLLDMAGSGNALDEALKLAGKALR